MAETFMTVNEAAEFLNVCTATLYRAIRAGTLPHVKIGRSIRISKTALLTHNEAPAQVTPPTTVSRAPVTRL